MPPIRWSLRRDARRSMSGRQFEEEEKDVEVHVYKVEPAWKKRA